MAPHTYAKKREQSDLTFNKYEDRNLELLRKLEVVYKEIRMGGGEKAMERHKTAGKLPVRERIDILLDDKYDFLEIGALAAYGMYESEGGCPSAGVITGIGRVSGKLCMIIANDATVKAGAWFPMSGKKNLRAQEIAMENRLPLIYLVDSAGVYLPMQDEIFPDKEHFGRIFRNNAKISAMGIPQIAAVMGPCVAGGAYLPIMSDESIIVEGTGSVFLAGPYLVKSAIGEDVDAQTLGGATTHTEISGVTDHKVKNDAGAIKKIRSLISKMKDEPRAGYQRHESKFPVYDPAEVIGIIPDSRAKPYNVLEVIERIVDAGSFDEFKQGFGGTLICGTANIDGWSVGILANQRELVKTKGGEMQVGGVIYSDSADKGARFVLNCNQKKIPLVFLQDVTGFMVGTRSEHGGIIKDGAKMVNAVANSVVPKFTFITGNSYGAGNYAMCGKAYDPRLIFAWPTAELAVMSGSSAAKTLLQIQVKSLEKKGELLSHDDQKELLKQISDRYNRQIDPYYAAARLWVDGIIDPRKTREIISKGIEMADHNPHIPEFKTGVIQT